MLETVRTLYQKSPKRWALLAVIIASFSIHFAYFGHPSSVVFDEVYFGKFISAYSTGEYYFDIHPPLGKLLIAGVYTPFHLNSVDEAAVIDTSYKDGGYLLLRLLPSISGALIPIIFFLLIFELGWGIPAALFGGLFLSFDNALLVQTHNIFLDGFLLLFLFSSVLFALKARKRKSLVFWIVSAVFAGASAGIKWTGAAALGIVACIVLFDFFRSKEKSRVRELLKVAAVFVTIPLAVYSLAFAIHFALLPKSGPGDAFMTPEFQKSLVGNPNRQNHDLTEPNFVGKFLELNYRMYTANRDLTAPHSYSSSWYSWPAMVRPIYYWVQNDSRIYLIGNPVVWWAAFGALILIVVLLFLQRIKHNLQSTFLLGAWAINFVPFVFIGRVMFLYHYLPALLFSVLVLVYLIHKLKAAKWIYLALGVVAFVMFVWFAPLSYGLPLDEGALKLRQWFPNWI